MHLPKGTKTIKQGMHKLFLSNEDKFQKEIEDLDLEGIFKDSIIKQHPTDPTKMLIASRNKRGNRGISLGYTGGHSLRKDEITGIAEPQITVDTWRYIPAAKKFTKLQQAMASEAGFQLIDESRYPDRQFKWAQKIDEEVMNELFSLLYLVHDDPKSLAFSDWLRKHVDSQNCPDWSFLGFTWHTFFHQPIGRFVTGVMTANWKKSVSDLDRRTGVINQAAQYIIDQLIATPEHLLKVTPETLCPPDALGDYRLLPIHTDPFVHLSPLIFSICRLRKFLWEVLQLRMSAYLRDEMIVAALAKTNNMFRFSKFSDEHFELWRSNREDPIDIGSTFLDAFQIWLQTRYSSNEGNHLRNNEEEGTIRYQCSRNTPTLIQTSHNNVRVFHNTMSSFARQAVTDVVYKNTLRSLDKLMEGVSDLKIQKMIYVCAVLGGHLSLDWINHCLPGSARHLARFKKQDFPLTTQNQVGQVVKVIASQHGLPLPVAEELVCSKLKTDSSAGSNDLAVKGQDMYSCRLNGCGQAEVWSLNAQTHLETRVRSGGFTWGNESHYRPTWSRGKDWAQQYRMQLRFTSDENLKFNVKKKLSVSQQKILRDETVFSTAADIGSKEVQVLLNKNRTLVIDVEFVAAIFKIEPSTLRRAIHVNQVDKGYEACIDESIFQRVRLLRCQVSHVKQMNQVKRARWPMLDRLVGDQCSYRTHASSVMGLLVHLLMNVRRRTGKSWSFPLLKHTKELVLVVPVSKNMTTLEVVCVLFRHDNNKGTKVMCRYFDERGKPYPAFEVATDDNGYFDDDSREEY
jgi:hypothetical protein